MFYTVLYLSNILNELGPYFRFLFFFGRFLATGMKYSDLSFTFRMGKSTICEFVRLTLDALWTNLWPIHMPVPITEQLLKISEDFHTLRNLPHCVGAIDVRHIEIKKPSHSGSLYYNYKGFHSITFQAVVDARYKYISIDVGGYGKQHDSANLKASSFYEALEENIIILPKAEELPGSETVVPYFLIRDGAYPLMQNLIKPFAGEELSDDQIKYNKRISGPRMVVECTFGQDCQRWHIYYTKIECEPETVERIARAISVMHNVIIDMEKGDKNEDNNKNQNLGFKKRNVTKESRPLLKIARPDENTALVQEGFPVGNGREVRERLMAYFKIQSNGKRSKKQCKKIKLK